VIIADNPSGSMPGETAAGQMPSADIARAKGSREFK
jgi:hypothetical protein